MEIASGGNIYTGATSSSVYRTTNAGSDVTAHFLIDPANSLTSGNAHAYSTADGEVFTIANGTRRISGAAFKLVNTTTTAGSEVADLGIFTKASGGAMAQRLQIGSSALTFSDAVDVVLNTTTGTKFGTGTTQKLAFYNSTPIVQPANTVAINDALVNLGLRASGGTSNFTTTISPATGTTSIAPITFTAGTNKTTPATGDMEFDGTNYFGSVSTTRYTFAKTLTATATLDFGSTAAGNATDLTITVTGAADGDAVSIGVPNGSTLSDGSFSAWVSAANTVTVRFTNNNLLSALDPASGTFRASVIKY